MNIPRKKLIEVALPLEAINRAAAREKSIRHGHPSTLHLWWARRPLAAARAVIFSQMVDDPGSVPEEFPTTEVQEKERKRLFQLIEDLVLWENTTNEDVLSSARTEIKRSWARWCKESGEDPEKLPPFHDPFAGGGALPLEAQRLGLEAYASDLNPVAVMINKAMIEIPPRFAGKPPVHPEECGEGQGAGSRKRGARNGELFPREWRGAQGLAEDVRYYGKWMRNEAERRIGHLYPKLKITEDMAKDRSDLKPYIGRSLTVIAWLWARTVESSNPAYRGCQVPLVSSFWLSTKTGREAWVEVEVGTTDGHGFKRMPGGKESRFVVRTGKPADKAVVDAGTKLGRGANFRCVLSQSPLLPDYIRSEAQAGRMYSRLMAIVCEGERGRVYLPPTDEQEEISRQATPEWKPEQKVTTPCHDVDRLPMYGMYTWGDAFTPRQLAALTTFSDLVTEAREKIMQDALGARASRPQKPVHSRGYLPHWEAGPRPQFVTFRLADSLPKTALQKLDEELQKSIEEKMCANSSRDRDHHGLKNDQDAHYRDVERRKRIEQYLDAGHGSCALQRPGIAELVEDALLFFDGTRYELLAWTIMPNHVHVLLTPLHDNSLSSIVHSWKSFTAKRANKLRETEGRFWQEEYFDRMIRDEAHFYATVRYIEENPVKAGLCETPEAWEYGHLAHRKEREEGKEGEDRAGRPRSQDERPLCDGGTGARAYAEAVSVYLAFVVDKCADYWSSICSWHNSGEKIRNTFGRQAIPMVWDYAEANPFCESTGNWMAMVDWTWKAVSSVPANILGHAFQADACGITRPSPALISTDPPYYDNIGYADLSDFFYVWLRKLLQHIQPELFGTLLVPKAEELVATPYRHGSKDKAEAFFLDGMTNAVHTMTERSHAAFPVSIYYAFKQAEKDVGGTASTGWETFLEAVIRAGFSISGTWPMRTELANKIIGINANILASSIVLVCRPRPADASVATRKEFLAALRRELPAAVRTMQGLSSPGARESCPQKKAGGTPALPGIAPVDLAQASIGPGMAIFSRYSRILETNDKPMTVRTALQLINQTLDETLAEQEGDFDPETAWAVAWFDQFGFNDGPFGDAETLSKAKNTALNALSDAGIVKAGGGKTRLLRVDELPKDWDPSTDKRLTVWEMVHHLVRVMNTDGESETAKLVAKLAGKAEAARELAYRLYSVCERRKRASEALAYNSLVLAWPELTRLAQAAPRHEQQKLF